MRRRAILLLAAMAAALAVSGGAAIAAAITCVAGSTQTNPCLGTAKTSTQSGDDVITGTSGTDWIAALSGNDKINAGGGNDITGGAEGNDTYAYGNLWGIHDTVQDDPATGSVDTLSFTAVNSPMNILLQDTATNPTTFEIWAYNPFTGAFRSGVDLTSVTSTGQLSSAKIENVVGGLSNDYIEDNNLVNKLTGGGGPDTIHAGFRGGNDQAFGGNDNDFLAGYNPNNILAGDKGDDQIVDVGPSSNDTYKYPRLFGIDVAEDRGGTADVADLKPFNSSELVQYKIDYVNPGDGNDETIVLELADGSMAALVNGCGGTGIIEQLQFANGTSSYTGPPAGSGCPTPTTTQQADTQADDAEANDSKEKIQKPSASKEKELKSKLPKAEDLEKKEKKAMETKKEKPKGGPVAEVVEE